MSLANVFLQGTLSKAKDTSLIVHSCYNVVSFKQELIISGKTKINLFDLLAESEAEGHGNGGTARPD